MLKFEGYDWNLSHNIYTKYSGLIDCYFDMVSSFVAIQARDKSECVEWYVTAI